MNKSYASIIENKIQQIPCNELIISSELYKEFNNKVSEQAFYKTLERLSKSENLIHLTKGVYYRPKTTRFGNIPITEKEIASHYIRNQKGLLIGYQMYNEKGITTQVGKKVEVLSTILEEDVKNIHNVSVNRIEVELDEQTIPVIETLEILQEYNKIEDINKRALVMYMEKFSKIYSEQAIKRVLSKRKYKKSTIAFMQAFLKYFQIENSLEDYLSPLSTYKIPNVEGLYEFA